MGAGEIMDVVVGVTRGEIGTDMSRGGTIGTARIMGRGTTTMGGMMRRSTMIMIPNIMLPPRPITLALSMAMTIVAGHMSGPDKASM